jgi:hypothetical protein
MTMAPAVLLAVTLTGCGGGGSDAASIPAPTTQAAQGPEEWERVPAKNRQGFLAVLKQADPGLVDGDNQQKRGLRRAVYTCREIDKGLVGDKLAIYVSQRFTGGHGTVSMAEGRRVAAAAQKWICPSLK